MCCGRLLNASSSLIFLAAASTARADGGDIHVLEAMQSIVERLEVGKTYPVKIRRDGKQQTVKVTVAEMAASSDRIRQRFRERKRQPEKRQPE